MTKNRPDVIPGISQKEHKEEAGLPAVRSEGFQLANPTFEVPAEYQGHIDPTDFDGFEKRKGSTLTIVSIRQKDLKGADGRTLIEPAGGFKIYDSVSNAANRHVPDLDGATGLDVTILMHQYGATYWRAIGDTRPSCKSLNGITGEGEPGGDCFSCPLSKFNNKATKPEEKRPKCGQEVNVLVWDHKSGFSYVLRLGRSGVKPYQLFIEDLNRESAGKMPVSSYRVKITTAFKNDIGEYFLPVFETLGQIPISQFLEFKNLRSDLSGAVTEAAQTDLREENDNPNSSGAHSINNAELPDDVTPIGGETDNAIPF